MKHHDKPSSFSTHYNSYASSLQSFSSTPNSIRYTYTTTYHDFATSLDPVQAGSLRQSDSVLDIYEDTLYTLYTTRSPEFIAIYVMLSNTYIESGSFKDGHTLREVMKEQGVRKEPGCSWVSLGGRVNKFYAGDQNHPQKDEVYAKLEELNVKVKSMGYIPELNISL
ncbi:hypothetical protein ACOSQ2_027308 [Xanthoceras sorbifolium]